MNLGERIKAERIKKGLTQTELGNEFGLKQSTICKYEYGLKRPPNETVVAFAKYFSVSTDYLLGLTDK